MEAGGATRRALIGCAAFSLSGTFATACSAADDSASPVVRLRLGMDVEELRANSTYPFGPDPSRGNGIGSYRIESPYDLQLVIDGAVVKIDRVAGSNLATFIIVTRGVVTNATLSPQTELLSLEGALQRAHTIADQLVAAGVLPRGRTFIVQNMDRSQQRPNVQSWEEARAAIENDALTIAEMSVFGGDSATSSMGLALRNGRRMLQLVGHRPSEIDRAVTVMRDGREWALQLEIVPRLG